MNNKNVDLDYTIKDGDFILHRTVREETPIYKDSPSVIKETNEYLIVNKPSSMPVHACGNFKYNTLQAILENELGFLDPPEKDKKEGFEYKGKIISGKLNTLFSGG